MVSNGQMYVDSLNVQVIIGLLKKHGIRYVIASPGSTNIPLVGCFQYDSYFTVISAIDERHAAYMACGIAAETGEPVVLSCTGATASRNYLPGLTEAYYRKLPILAITASQVLSHAGNLWPQMIDRSSVPVDAVRCSVNCPYLSEGAEKTECELLVNKAILELYRHGGGPVHLNVEIKFGFSFGVQELPPVRKISRVCDEGDEWPEIENGARIVVLLTSHAKFTVRENELMKSFLANHNAVLLSDSLCSYRGPDIVFSELLCEQCNKTNPAYQRLKPSLIIHVGEITENDATCRFLRNVAPVWRVSEDGEPRDLLGRLEIVFEMRLKDFLSHYVAGECGSHDFRDEWMSRDTDLRKRIPMLPFSNMWIASQLMPRIPPQSSVHLGIRNSLRCWNFQCSTVPNYYAYSNVGGYGIDGCLSSAVGASLVSMDKEVFTIVGNLAFYYDMNALGNRAIGRNLHILVVNNDTGGEMRMSMNPGSKFGDRADDYIAAGGHFKSARRNVIRNFVESLGFKYLVAGNKDELMAKLPEFFALNSSQSVVMECFVSMDDDRLAVDKMKSIDEYHSAMSTLSQAVKSVVSKFC